MFTKLLKFLKCFQFFHSFFQWPYLSWNSKMFRKMLLKIKQRKSLKEVWLQHQWKSHLKNFLWECERKIFSIPPKLEAFTSSHVRKIQSKVSPSLSFWYWLHSWCHLRHVISTVSRSLMVALLFLINQKRRSHNFQFY